MKNTKFQNLQSRNFFFMKKESFLYEGKHIGNVSLKKSIENFGLKFGTLHHEI